MPNDIKYALLRVLPFLVAIIIIGIVINRKRISKEAINLQAPSFKKLFIWWFLYVIFIFVHEYCLYKAGLLTVNHWNNRLIVSVIFIIGIVILAPILEELIFRGILLNKMTQWKINKHVAILIQALIFVLSHAITYQNTLNSNIGIVQLFVDAIWYAYARYSTKSIYTPMLMHSTGNLIAVIEKFIL
jgi:membrane protease YdiL (CAAX protease family)